MAARMIPKGDIVAYGEIFAKDYGVAISVSDSGFTKITSFNTNGESVNMTPDYINNHIKVNVSGTYMVMCSIAIENSLISAHTVEVSMFKNNGTVEFPNIHAHRSLAASADKGSISISGIVSLVAGEIIEMWATSDSSTARDITIRDITLSLRRIGD